MAKENRIMSLNSYENEMIKVLRNSLGGEQGAVSYTNGMEGIPKIDILLAVNSPCEGEMTASTLGLVNRTTGIKAKDKDIRAEIVTCFYPSMKDVPRLLTSLGIHLLQSEVPYRPGSVYQNIVSQYFPNSEMKHLILTLPPQIWKENITMVPIEDSFLTVLCAHPISDAEYEYIMKNGLSALDQIFAEKGTDMSDYERKSVI